MGFLITYNKLFDLSLWHDHFLAPGPGTFSPPPVPADLDRLTPYQSDAFLSLHISDDTHPVLSNKGLIFKKNRYGCLVARKATFAETDTGAKVSLLAKLRDPEFINYTALGFDVLNPSRKGKVFYLFNKGLVADGSGRINLSRSPGHFLTIANNLYDWQTRMVRLAQVVPGTSTVVEVFDATSAAIAPVLTLGATSGPGATEYLLDCRDLPSGLYRFQSANLSTKTLYIGQENSSSDVLAVIDVFLSTVNGAKFDIRFNHN